MWTELTTGKDITCFLEKVNYLVDSCIKEMKYVSGSYSENGTSLYASNDRRDLYILFHSMSGCFQSLELKFSGVHKLVMSPSNEQDSVIYDTTFFKKDGLFYWFDHEEGDIRNVIRGGTAVAAKKVSWRLLDNAFGKEDFYAPKQP